MNRIHVASALICLLSACSGGRAPAHHQPAPGAPPPGAPPAAPVAAGPPGSCLDLLQRGGGSVGPGGEAKLTICDTAQDDAVRQVVDGGRDVPVIPKGCRLERLCGQVAGVDCESAVDGPYDYYELGNWDVLAQCGGACMSGSCTNCPPPEMTCPTY